MSKKVGSFCICQVREYHPEPWNQWLKIGDLDKQRGDHAILSVGPEQLSCLSGGSILECASFCTLSCSIIFPVFFAFVAFLGIRSMCYLRLIFHYDLQNPKNVGESALPTKNLLSVRKVFVHINKICLIILRVNKSITCLETFQTVWKV